MCGLTDYFNACCDELSQKKLFLFDMDGTIYEENRLFDGTLDILKKIEEKQGKYVFITNNSSKAVYDYIEKLTGFGIRADETCFFTSSQATSLYIREKYGFPLIYCVGTASLRKELERDGLCFTDCASPEAELVLAGFDTELTYQKLRGACELLSAGRPFLATNCDLVCPVSFGFIPDCGSICRMLTNATGREPLYIGKPEPTMALYVMQTTGIPPEETVIIGDRLYTDIATGINAGITSVCVLTGEATVQDIISGDIKPTYTLNSVRELCDCIS